MNFNRFALAALTPLAAVSLAGCGVNSVPTAEENAKAKWANVQADFQKRADLIPSLVETVKGAAKSEANMMTEVINARAKATSVQVSAADLSDPAKMKQFQDAQNQVTSSLGRLLVSVEQYPQFKANANFVKLQDQLEGVNNRINISLKDYNEAVQGYNTTIRTFPDAIGAKIFYGAKPMVTYQATQPGAENAPVVNFDTPAANTNVPATTAPATATK